MKFYSSYSEIQLDLQEGLRNCVDILTDYLSRIEDKKELNIFLEVFHESALKKAKEVDEKLTKGTAGKLAGMIIGIKDNMCYKGHKVSASSKILENFESLYSSTVVERLLKDCEQTLMRRSTVKLKEKNGIVMNSQWEAQMKTQLLELLKTH